MTDALGQPATMRMEDHQLQAAFYAARFTKGVKWDSEHTGFGWKTEATFTGAELTQPTTCKMKRPAGS